MGHSSSEIQQWAVAAVGSSSGTSSGEECLVGEAAMFCNILQQHHSALSRGQVSEVCSLKGPGLTEV